MLEKSLCLRCIKVAVANCLVAKVRVSTQAPEVDEQQEKSVDDDLVDSDDIEESDVRVDDVDASDLHEEMDDIEEAESRRLESSNVLFSAAVAIVGAIDCSRGPEYPPNPRRTRE